MKKITFMLGCMLLCSSLASADGNTPFRADVFPSRKVIRHKKMPVNGPERVLNDEKAYGVGMWAVTNVDYTKDPGFVHFYSGRTNTLEKTGILASREDDPERLTQLTGGAWHNGAYYGYLFKHYDIGGDYLKGFIKADLEKGTYEYIKKIPDDDYILYTDLMEAMATNPKNGKLMGTARATDGSVSSTIGEVNPATGEYTIKKNLDKYYLSMDYDADGTLWGLHWVSDRSGNVVGAVLATLDEENDYEYHKVCDLVKGGQPFHIYYPNTMRFDYTTGDLWLIAWDSQSQMQYVYKVNTETGEMEPTGAIGYWETVVGLYIPSYTADAPGAAFRVTGISSSFDTDGGIVLEWTNPTTTWDKNELKELAEVLVYRDGLAEENLIATITDGVTVGGDMTYTDKNAEKGVHTYYIVPCRVKGEKGIPESWRAYSGEDTPGMPENITLTKEGSSLKLTWTMPEFGSHDGQYDKSAVKYTIIRYPDEKVVAENYTQTSFTDSELGERGNYYYTITPSNNEGEGPVGTSETILAGKALEVPFSTAFDTQKEADQWTMVDANNDYTTFDYMDWWSPKGIFLNTTTYNANDDYVVSPALDLKAGKTYKVTYNLFFTYATIDRDPDRSHNFRFTAGQGVTAADQTIELRKEEKFQNFSYNETIPFETTFTPETDGEYSFAFNYTTERIAETIGLVGFSVEEVVGKDLAVEPLDGNLSEVVKGSPSDFNVIVNNKGNDAADAYRVQIVRLTDDGNVTLGETEVTEKLESQKQDTIKVAAVPDIEGEMQIAAVVLSDGDEVSDNNTSAPFTVNADPEGLVPFNTIVTGDYESTEQRAPISFEAWYSESQSIYHSDEIKLDEEAYIHRLAFRYDGEAAVDDFDVSVYLGLTKTESVDDKSLAWIPLENLTKVYEGKQFIEEGADNMMKFELSEPFKYDPSMNLVVTVCKSGNSPDTNYPATFEVYNYNWDLPYRTLVWEDPIDAVATAGNGYAWCDLPVLFLAVDNNGGTGISEIVVGGEGISFNGETINLNGIDAVSLTVYDLMGRAVLDKNVADGVTSVKAALGQGVYVVKVVDRSGKVYTKKFRTVK